MGHAQSSNNKLASSESKQSPFRRNASIQDGRSSSRSFTLERWRHSEGNTSKYKLTKLGSIRRKLVRRTRKGSDYRTHIQNLLHSWSIKEIQSFIREYEALEALRDLTRLSNNARVKAPSLKSDIANLYEKKYCSDTEIVYQNVTFHVHKAVLCAHCHFFRDYLGQFEWTDSIKLESEDFDYSPSLFSSLLKYIYSGFTKDRVLTKLLPSLSEKFGLLNSLDDAMRQLLESNSYADLILVFPNMLQSDNKNIEDVTINNTFEVYCHSAILCARSLYLRSLLIEQMNLHKAKTPLKLVISENIIPRSYIRVILQCLYTDSLDLSSVIKWKVADDGSGEADRLLTTVELAMELYEIAQFLDFPVLKEACEDLIVQNLNVYTLLAIWDWSSQAFGSQYVHRQSIQYFSDEFCILCKSVNLLANMPKQLLLSAIKSDFLQASEEYTLSIVIKWGEWQIVKANEKSGVGPANSLPRRSPKRRDIKNEDLKEMIADLLIHIRLKHILPPNSSVLQSAYQRGLLERPFDFGSESEASPASMVVWLREFRHSDYTRPRLFPPFVDEVKLILHERVTYENCHTSSSQQCMPDMLPRNYASVEKIDVVNRSPHDSVSWIFDISQLDPSMMKNMIMRQKELKTSAEVLRALAVAPDNMEISRKIQLCIVREFGLPDELASQIFSQSPDLIEVDSSSDSSKQSTLTKIGHLINSEELVSSISSIDSNDSAPISSYLSNCSNENALRYCSQGDENPVQIHAKDYESVFKTHNSQTNEHEENNNRTTLTLDLSHEAIDIGDMSNAGIRSVDDSPLDLPSLEHILVRNIEIPLPNVLLDT